MWMTELRSHPGLEEDRHQFICSICCILSVASEHGPVNNEETLKKRRAEIPAICCDNTNTQGMRYPTSSLAREYFYRYTNSPQAKVPPRIDPAQGVIIVWAIQSQNCKRLISSPTSFFLFLIYRLSQLHFFSSSSFLSFGLFLLFSFSFSCSPLSLFFSLSSYPGQKKNKLTSSVSCWRLCDSWTTH